MRRYTVSIGDRAFTIEVHQTALDRFEVSVDGRTFEAQVDAEEDLPGGPIEPGIPVLEVVRPGGVARSVTAGSSPAPAAPATAPVWAVAPAPASGSAPAPVPASGPAGSAPAPASGSAGSRADNLAAPMPGVILEVRVATGAQVRRGDPLVVLEAMKMRNVIRAPRDAVVQAILVEAGQPVRAGDGMVRFGPVEG